MGKPSSFLLLAATLSGVAVSCNGPDSQLCMEGYARDNKDRCQPIADTDDTGSSRPNTVPTAPAIGLQPAAPREFGLALVCGIDSESIDTDGDAVSYAFTWTLNGTETASSERLTSRDQWTSELPSES